VLREGLHVWVFTLPYAAVKACNDYLVANGIMWRIVPIALALWDAEIAAMLILPTIVTNGDLLHFNDVMAFAIMLSGILLLSLKMAGEEI
jgi:hypothetical protein